ncbi:uncharacterized protein ACIBXB_008993 [Morphnus guianensis]
MSARKQKAPGSMEQAFRQAVPATLSSAAPPLFSTAAFCQRAFSARGQGSRTHGISPRGYSTYNRAGSAEGEHLTRPGRSVPGEVCGSLAQTRERNPSPSSRLWDTSLAPSSSTEAPAQEPRPTGASAGCDPAAATSCALPGGVGLAVAALRLPLRGAALLFPALLRLWRERGRHLLLGNGLRPQLPSPLCRGGWMRHPVRSSVQVPPLPSSLPPGEGASASHLAHPFPLAPRAFCWQHRPEQAVEAAPEENTTCLICLDLVEERKSYGTMVCPACKHAWFHRGCIQAGAVPSPPGFPRPRRTAGARQHQGLAQAPYVSPPAGTGCVCRHFLLPVPPL